MKVLFLKEVEHVAAPGDVKDVAAGYARNYLLPKQFAVAATPGTLKQHSAAIEHEKKRVSKLDADQRAFSDVLGKTQVTLKGRAGAEGRLYGSITSAEIAVAVSSQVGAPIDRRLIVLDEPIRRLGEYEVVIRLRRDLTPKVKVVVEAENA